MDDFSKCQPGDRLWSIQLGECDVESVESKVSSMRINCKSLFDERVSLCYFTNGLYYASDAVQSLYWTNPNIIPPLKPKKKVKGELERWVAIYRNINGEIHHSSLFNSYGLCTEHYHPLEYKIIKIIIPYEIEVDE